MSPATPRQPPPAPPRPRPPRPATNNTPEKGKPSDSNKNHHRHRRDDPDNRRPGQPLPAAARPSGHVEAARRRRGAAQGPRSSHRRRPHPHRHTRTSLRHRGVRDRGPPPGRLRFASLPTPATLEDFDYDTAPAVDPKLINELATCRYIESATNVLLIGQPGLGKTHLAVGLARKAAEAGYRTYFTTAADLAARCHRAAIEGRWATTMRFFNGPSLLVIDELGYLPLPAEAASALFQVVSQRYLKTSIVLTSNRGVASWGEVLGDTTVAAALLDRLLHRSVVLTLEGDSYRLRDHQARTDTLRQATTGTRQPLR
ncbi:IS21-like element helper ATPase IstB [Saccharopolyspora spinosa]|uniref:IS21-like element helper ATPase IstB n=1 Tax=Saccharopolyspora spinosa TaxID=60894 RepID=UPI0037498F77